IARDQIRLWHDDFALFEHALRVTNANSLIENNYAVALQKAGRTNEAVEHLRAALKIKPDYGQPATNLPAIPLAQGSLDDGILLLKTAAEHGGNKVQAFGNLGIAYFGQGKLALACEQFRNAVAADPPDGQSNYYLGIVLIDMHRDAEAVIPLGIAVH